MNPEIDPSTIVRAYIWAVLKKNDPLIWNESKYDGLIPIVPFGEDSQLSQFEGPSITYISTHSAASGPKMIGSTTMMISSVSARTLMRAVNIIRVALDREDDSATDINRFTTNHIVDAKYPFIGLRFGYIRMAFSEGPQPADSEGGRNYASFSAEYEYYVDYSVQTAV